MASAPMAGLEAALRLRFDAQIDVDARELRPAHRGPHFSVRWLTQNNEGRAKYRGGKFSGADQDDQPELSGRPCLRISPQRADEEVLRRLAGSAACVWWTMRRGRRCQHAGPALIYVGNPYA